MPNYILNGEVVEVAPEHVEIFKAQNPSSKVDGDSSAQIARDILPTPGKTIDPASENTDSGSVDFSSELPQVTMKDVDQREAKAVELLNKKFGGLGFSFRQNETFGTDGVIITAPNKADGTPGAEQKFQTDLDVLGFSTYSDHLWGTSSKAEAKAINDFIKANTNSPFNI